MLTLNHLKLLWLDMNQICSKKMKEALPLWLKYYTSAPPEVNGRILQLEPAGLSSIPRPFEATGGPLRIEAPAELIVWGFAVSRVVTIV